MVYLFLKFEKSNHNLLSYPV